MNPTESRIVIGKQDSEDGLPLRLKTLNGEYCQALNHSLAGGPYAGQVAATVLLSDEGLVELDRLAGDEAADELDRISAQILTHHPHSLVRLDRLRVHANHEMDRKMAAAAANRV
jgi:hypothetical protein